MKSKRSIVFYSALAILLIVGLAGNLRAEETRRLLNLRGDWKFKTGDKTEWADPKFDDSKWSEIYAPSAWEDEGYDGYDGYAWYRKHFTISENWLSKDLVLNLGTIDDVDEVYVNGQCIGSTGSFPPNYSTAYNIERRYSISPIILKSDGDNVIAVRVYDNGGAGGITNGRLGLYERRNVFHADLMLPYMWKFNTGDNLEWKEVKFDDSNWKTIHVPDYWEHQGYPDYDGYAWYRVKFNVPDKFQDDDLVFLVGKIDDFDETYLNGERIGGTGPMPTQPVHYTNSDEYRRLRTYTIPEGALRPGTENVLAVRVYDCWQGGGIYEGPIGIVTREHYTQHKWKIKNFSNWFWNWLEDIFD